MKRLRVARIPYLNSVPFYVRLQGEGIELLDLPPRALGRRARAGDVDAGIMSLCDGFRSPDFEPLGRLGVAADGPVHSVLLFGRVPLERLTGATIGVTSETSTSLPLCRLLLEGRYGVHPAVYARRPDGARPGDAALLLIGDAALRTAAVAGLRPGERDYAEALLELPSPGPEAPWRWLLDLSAAWREWQGLPFVFARWMVRHQVPARLRERLLAQLDESLEASLRELGPLAGRHAAQAGLDADAAYAYLMNFTYRLGEAELEAVARFRALLEGAPWWQAQEPRWVAGPEA